MLVGMPPKDLIDVVATAWREAGLDVDECFLRAASVTNEWKYVASCSGNANTRASERISSKWVSEQTIPHKLRTLRECIDPQPLMATVIRDLLDWIIRVDWASRGGLPPPAFKTVNGNDIFPKEELWWLTDVQRKEEPEEENKLVDGDEDGPWSEDEKDLEDAPPEDALTDDEDPLSDADATCIDLYVGWRGSTIESRQSVIDATEANGRNQAHRSEAQWGPPVVKKRQGAFETPVATSSCLSFKKHKLEGETATGASLEDGATTVAPTESASQEISPFMRACGNNPDPSVPRADQ